MIIPTENRAMLAAIRDGRSLKQYLDDIWARRDAEHPKIKKSRWKWPALEAGQVPQKADNVRQIGSRASGKRT